jgi:hypothetical protein
MIHGDLRVVARLAMGLEYLRLFFTDRRIIVAHIGKRGAGSQATLSFFGRLSAVIEELLKGGRESVGKGKLGESAPEEILASDRDNFFVSYSDIVELTLDQTSVRPRLIILTRDDKFQFTVLGMPTNLTELLEKVLHWKLRIL